MTILEMLDVLAAELAVLRAGKRPAADGARAAGIAVVKEALAGKVRNGRAQAGSALEEAPDNLESLMRHAGLSHAEFAAIFGVHAHVIEQWLSGRESPPNWVPVTVRTLALLDPEERRRLIENHLPRVPQSSRRTHPFSRIEEL